MRNWHVFITNFYGICEMTPGCDIIVVQRQDSTGLKYYRLNMYTYTLFRLKIKTKNLKLKFKFRFTTAHTLKMCVFSILVPFKINACP